MNKTVLITGVAGFLGRNLAKRYLKEGYIVFGVDDFTTSNRSLNDFQELLKQERFYFKKIDVIDQNSWNECYPWIDDVHDSLEHKGKFLDLILNFACPASPPQYCEIPIKTTLTSVVGIYNALNFANNAHCTIVQASTSEVYGDATTSPQDETYWGNVNPCGVRSNYDEGKRCAESLCFDFIRKYDTDVRVVRIFNTYGDMNIHDGRVISNFVCRALYDEPVDIYGDGTQTRSFCYSSDLIEAIWRVSQLQKNELVGPINIGNDKEFTLLELVKVLEKCLNKQIKIDFKPLPQDDPKQRRPDLTKAKSLLNWEAKVSLEEGINKIIPWFKAQLNL